MARRKKHEEHLNAEAWAIPYGDLVTLLLAFFVVMYAVSSVNEGKYRVLSDSLARAFKGTPKSLAPIQMGKSSMGGNDKAARNSPLNNAIVDPGARAALREPGIKKSLNLRKVNAAGGEEVGPEARARREFLQREEAKLKRVAVEVEAALAELLDKKLVVVRNMQFWLEIEVQADVLFQSGSSEMPAEAQQILSQLAEILAPLENSLRIEGHTDTRPIATLQFPSNWELSAARAASVVHRFSKLDVAPERMSVLGFGEHRPIADNDTVEGRNKNRRVAIVVLSDAADDLSESRAVDALRARPAQADATVPKPIS